MKQYDFSDLYNRVQLFSETGAIQAEGERPLPNTVEDLGEIAIRFLNLVTQYLPSKEEIKDSNIKVLDLGCHSGYNTKMLKEKYGHCVGVDLNPELVKKAESNGNECYVIDMHHLKDVFPNETFNLIFAKDIIEHSYDPDYLLSLLYNVLKLGGYLLAFIPMDGGTNPRIAITTEGGNPAHVWKTNYQDCEERFLRAKFQDLKIYKHSVQKDIGYTRNIGDDIGVLLARKF